MYFVFKLVLATDLYGSVVLSGNGTTRSKKCKKLFEYNIYSHLETSGGLCLNVVHFKNTSVKYTSVAALDDFFPALVSNMHCSINRMLQQI